MTKTALETELAELDAELLWQFTCAADWRAQAKKCNDWARQHDAQAERTRRQIERLQGGLVQIAVSAVTEGRNNDRTTKPRF